MKLNYKIILVSVLSALAVGAIAETNSNTPAAVPQLGGNHFGKIRAFLIGLNLSEEQKTKLKTVLHENKTEVRQLVDELIDERRALADEVKAVPVNEDAIREQSAVVAAIEADLAVKRGEIHEQVATILTPEQIAKTQAAEAKIRERMDSVIGGVRSFIDTI